MARQKKLIKLLQRLIQPDHQYTDEELREMKQSLCTNQSAISYITTGIR